MAPTLNTPAGMPARSPLHHTIADSGFRSRARNKAQPASHAARLAVIIAGEVPRVYRRATPMGLLDHGIRLSRWWPGCFAVTTRLASFAEECR